GLPIWRRPELLADPWATQEQAAASIEVESIGAGERATDGAADASTAETLLTAVAKAIGLPTTQVMPAYEDPLVRMGELAALPPGDPGEDPTLPTARGAALAAAAAEADDESDLTPHSD
ncbi:transglutaminase-like family protein, partial [Streptomyces sp. SID10244]|nr:transglutaminase-like family protein [Streptomyces sp. SID10244]